MKQAFEWLWVASVENFEEHEAPEEFAEFVVSELAPYGFYDGAFALDLSFTQGSGASITGKVALETWLREAGRATKYPLLFAVAKGERGEAAGHIVRTDSRYVHQYTTKAKIECYDNYVAGEIRHYVLRDEVDECERELTEWIQHKNHEFYKRIEDYYWSLREDDAVVEYIEGYTGTDHDTFLFDREGNYPPEEFD